MRDDYFDLPVTIETEQPGQFLTVTHTTEAAQYLLHRWPKSRRGSLYREALQSLLDVAEQRKEVMIAREAFTAAAKEANIFICEGHRFD